ncbi:MAG: proline dehydrogenase family protein [Oligoflexales bacterium]
MAYFVFWVMANRFLAKLAERITYFAFRFNLPVKFLIKRTVFGQFCGGENLAECRELIQVLTNSGVGSILDYAVEGGKSEQEFDATAKIVKEVINEASKNEALSFCVFKPTGVARFALLEKASAKEEMTNDETEEFFRVKSRIKGICEAAYHHGVRVFIDAEESWIQNTIDDIALEMMTAFNKHKPLVYTTVQMYRKDRLQYLNDLYALAKQRNFFVGVKLVRGAYLEKERERARRFGYESPLFDHKQGTDEAFDHAMAFCLKCIDHFSICAGTHNQRSTISLVSMMQQNNIAKQDKRVQFAQLLGMSDNLTFNLAHEGYNVSKYVPFGPVQKVLPYLSRRANENSAIKGQTSRELFLLGQELRRRLHGENH